jgi:hypothetical protein
MKKIVKVNNNKQTSLPIAKKAGRLLNLWGSQPRKPLLIDDALRVIGSALSQAPRSKKRIGIGGSKARRA